VTPRVATAEVAFRAVTEAGDVRADQDQYAMARLRHSLVAALADGRDLLDIACGTGYALPQLAARTRSTTAGDRDPANVGATRAAVGAHRVLRCDAERPPFRDASFDVVSCLEAIYYLSDWRGFLTETRRLLRPGGTIVISWPNPARPAFDPSPASTVYPAVGEMVRAAARAGLPGTCFGAFPLGGLATARRPALDLLRRSAVRLRLIPRSLRWRMLIKRLVYRRMRPLGTLTLLSDPFRQLVELTPHTGAEFAMFYYVGTAA
jgi:SAM-dependent methyltransferase